MGKRAVSELCSFPEIDHVTVVGRSREKYEKFLEQVHNGSDKLRFELVDLNRAENLSLLFKDYDLVASTAGPFYKYERMLAAAAMEAGVDYVSICDDFDAAEQVFELDAAVREKGLCVLTGVGWTPGLSSLLARAAADSLDTVEKINVAWAGNTEDAVGLAVILHSLHIFCGSVPSFLDGSLKMVPAGSGKERIRFPEPIGELNVYNVGHPEPVTMHRYFPGIAEVTLKGGINEDLLNKLAILASKLGLSRNKKVRDLVAAFFQKTLRYWRRAAGSAPEVSGIRVDVKGTSAGAPCRLSYSAVGPMDVLTGVPMAIAIREMARGNIDKKGVLAPEASGLFDPQIFFNELRDRDVEVIIEKAVDVLGSTSAADACIAHN